MAACINKWSVALHSIWVLALFAFHHPPVSPTTEKRPPALHPFHVSVIEVNHSSTDKTLEISCKIFTDDFERALIKNYKTKVDLLHPTNKAVMDTLIKKYIASHLSIKVNGKPTVFTYLGSENEDAATYGYIEAMQVPTASKIEITTTLMYDLFDDQVNIMHVIVGGQRKSNKLNYPDKVATFSF
ncbi:MAG: hypothetical protein RIR12_790 [Bacteroidota bacterium]|jgi:hypothetical protein